MTHLTCLIIFRCLKFNSIEYINNDLKNILVEHNKKNYNPKIVTYYNKVKELEKCIMFFDSDPLLQNYSTKIISIEGYVVYFRF